MGSRAGNSSSSRYLARSFRREHSRRRILASLCACHGSYDLILRLFGIDPGISDRAEILRERVGIPRHDRNLAGQLLADLHVFQPLLVARIFRIFGFPLSLALGWPQVAADA